MRPLAMITHRPRTAPSETLSSSPYCRVVVPCDGLPDARLLTVGDAVAKRLDVPLVLLSIVSAGLEQRDTFELQASVDRTHVDATAIVRPDDGRTIEEQLGEAAGEAGSLLCMQTNARSPKLEALSGSTGERVIRSAAAEVLVVGPRCDSGFAGRTMIIAVPDGEGSEPWVESMHRAASQLRLEPTVVTVADDQDPRNVLVAVSSREDVALIAMATQRKSTVRRLVVGSTTLAVMSRARCPVLVRSVDEGDRR